MSETGKTFLAGELAAAAGVTSELCSAATTQK